jgi:NADPH:quinone reductase-like Zn-dependent oxidoreductase
MASGARALWYVAPGAAELRDDQAPDPGLQEIRIRALHGAVSRGTESLIFNGRVPESEYQRMRAPFMAGAFPFPVKYGYAVVGQVESGAAEWSGRHVFALHPHQSLFTLPAVAVVAVPQQVPLARAVLTANMETALNAVWDGAPGPADRIAVVGTGVVGALVAYLCATLPGSDVTLVDVDTRRAELAKHFGISFALPEDAEGECDLVFHASGTSAGLATAIALAGEESRIIELSWYGEGDVAAPLGGAFHSRRLALVASQVGKVAPSRRARWSSRRRLAAAAALLADPRLDILLAPPVAFGDLPAALPAVLAPGSGVLCQQIDYLGS